MLRRQGRTLRGHGWTGGLLALAVAGAGLAAGTVGCGGEDEGPACVSTREYFTTQVYGKALQNCTGCHTPGGVAEQKGAKFMIFRETYPDFVSANIINMRYYAELEVEGKAVLLRKPLGERQHGGGAVLSEDSEDYKILAQFVEQLRSGEQVTCDGNAATDVQMLSTVETARKAALLLGGRYPTDEELAQSSTDVGLEAFVEQLTREEPFYDVLRETWNDVLLTARGVDAGNARHYNNAPEFYDDQYPGYTGDKRTWATISMTEEPLRLIDYIVRNDLPFSDVVTANYMVANPYTARLYGMPHEAAATPENFLDWRRIDYSPAQNRVNDGAATTVAVPVAGVLSTPAFLTRWETTPTNRGRKRAAVVMRTFLATDILKFAQRPVDSTALTSVQNPTLNSPMCSVCHTVMDPIAGGFRGFGENEMARFNSADKWHDDMLPPGYNGIEMPPSSYGSALMWLGAQIPRDSRFGISVAQVMYQGIIGDAPLTFPQDKAAADYTDKVRAYNAQNDWFVQIGADFTASQFNLRKLVSAIVRSPYFRARSGDSSRDALHDGLGPRRLLTPEQLGRKYRATTGLYYFANNAAARDERRARDGYLRSDLVDDTDWRLVYGGIDSGDVTRRTTTMSPLMLATSQHTGAMVACRATAYDFTKNAGDRRLFPKVEMNTVPFTPRANADVGLVPVPDAEGPIRENIKHLMFRLLGESVEVDSEEVTQLFTLFSDVWKDLEDKQLREGNNKGLWNDRCAARTDWDKPVRFEPNEDGNIQTVFESLPEWPRDTPYQAGLRIDRDENFTVRAWQSVITYLLTDYRFTHE